MPQALKAFAKSNSLAIQRLEANRAPSLTSGATSSTGKHHNDQVPRF